MFTDFGKKPLLANWLPWQQGNVYFWFMRLKILLIPSFEKLPSFKVLACSVVEFWAIYWAGGGKHPPPSAYRVKKTFQRRPGIQNNTDEFVPVHFNLPPYTLNQVIPGNDQNTSPTNQGATGSKLDRTS